MDCPGEQTYQVRAVTFGTGYALGPWGCWKVPDLVNIQKRTGKSPCFMGKSTASMAIFTIFNSKLLVYQRVTAPVTVFQAAD
jgi:hypothetical protein